MGLTNETRRNAANSNHANFINPAIFQISLSLHRGARVELFLIERL
jgi:hypothetical protein